MKLNPIGTAIALSALALGVCAAAVAAPHYPFGGGPMAADEDETTISVKTSREREATVVKVPEMRVGETRTLTSESGKPVEVTRRDGGFTLKVGEKTVEVRTPDADGSMVVLSGDVSDQARVFSFRTGEGPADGKACQKRVVVMQRGDGSEAVENHVVVSPHAGHAFWFGDGKRPSAADLLEKGDLKALQGADARTRETVERALDELIQKGAVAPIGVPRVVTVDGDGDGDGEQVEIRVEKRSTK